MLIAGNQVVRTASHVQHYVTFVVSEHIRLVYLEVRGQGELDTEEKAHADWYELDITPDGAVTVFVEGEPAASAGDQLVLVHPGARHYGRLRPNPCFQGYSLFLAKELLLPRLAPTPGYSLVEDPQQRMQKLFALVSPCLQDALAHSGQATADDFVADLLTALVGEVRRGMFPSHLPEGLQRLLRFLETSYAELLTIDDLASAAAMSKYHLIRRFKTVCGMTPMRYLTDLRLRHAAELLRRDTARNVAEIAYEVGFNDIGAFNRQFKRRFAVSPRQYRQHLDTDE